MIIEDPLEREFGPKLAYVIVVLNVLASAMNVSDYLTNKILV